MQVVASDDMYLVTADFTNIPADQGGGTFGFLIVPYLDRSNIHSVDFSDTHDETYVPDAPWARATFIAAIKEMFDNKTFSDGTTSCVTTNPVITQISQTSTNVTP